MAKGGKTTALSAGRKVKASEAGRVLEVRQELASGPPPEHRAMVEALLGWFAREQRDLPWRRTYSPYAVWVSEIMLQQTQMDRAAAYFTRWMQRFPDLQSLAEADPDEALKAWEGLGYYSRVRNMQKAAQILVREHGGIFPQEYAELRALPGVGDYTAGAVLSIAFNRPHPAVDANVERVFARIFDIDTPVKSVAAADFFRHMAEGLIPEGRAREFNQALMELGALVCSKKPRCEICPVTASCQARRLDIVHERPVPGRRVGYSAVEIITGVLLHRGRVFLQKRLDSGVWAGFWEFPGGRLEPGETPEQGVVREFMEETAFAVTPSRRLGLVRHAYTRYKISMHCFECRLEGTAATMQERDSNGFPVPALSAATEYRWALPDDLKGFVLPAGHRKLLDAWLPELLRAAAKSARE